MGTVLVFALTVGPEGATVFISVAAGALARVTEFAAVPTEAFTVAVFFAGGGAFLAAAGTLLASLM